MGARIAVVCFPGSNCEHDVAEVLARLGATPRILWHEERQLDADAVVLPGGFAHGDYLRPGAIARFSPVMSAVADFAAAGGPVLGICNGFQVLTEAGMLPGALRRNDGLRFICDTVGLTVASSASVLTATTPADTKLRLPINHYEGNYTCDAATLELLQREARIVLRYTDNPNGSIDDIAGITNSGGNVVGLMPHPERASDLLVGCDDGLGLLESFVAASERFAAAGTAAAVSA
jgi:phosphoribosylformylglycinamidine synthase I